MTDYEEGDLLKDPTTNQPIKLFGLEKTEMVFIEKGSFIMGEDDDTIEINFNKGYFIGKYPVTQELYEKVMGRNPSYFKGRCRPVETITWIEICEEKDGFLTKLNDKIQKKIPTLKGRGNFKLASEAQWEYAARGGERWNNPQLEFVGSQNIKDVAWHDKNSNKETKPVGLKQANTLGLYDMNGNVWEWCEDLYSNIRNVPKDGSANTMQGSKRVLRGGSCLSIINYCRITCRLSGSPDFRGSDYGFRLVFPQFIP